MNEVEKSIKEKMTVTVKMTVPLLFWEEWNMDCKSSFGNARWLKLKHDHEYYKSFKSVSELIVEDLVEVKSDMRRLEETFLSELTSTIEECKKSSNTGSQEPKQARKTYG